MKSENTNWNKAGVWICTKCMKGTDFAENLKTDWKKRLKESGLGSEVRIMTSSCLSACPPDEQALLIAQKGQDQEIVVFDPAEESEKAFQHVLRVARDGKV